jgi:hypothetical protein
MRGLPHAALIFGLFPASLALAQTERPTLVEGDVSLDYRRGSFASACPEEAAFRERAADLFDFHDPFVPKGSPASAHMRLEIIRTETGFLGTVFVVDSGKGLATSTEQHTDCDALVWALSHRMALAILPAHAVELPAPPVSAPLPPAAPAHGLHMVPARTPCDERCAAELQRRHPARLDATPDVSTMHMAGAVMTAGLTPEPGWGIWLGTGARIKQLSIAFEGRAVLPGAALAGGDGPGATAAFSGLFVPCGEWRSFSACAFVEVGALLLNDGADTRGNMAALISVGPRVSAALQLGHGVALRAFVELDLHPYTPMFIRRNPRDDDKDISLMSTATGTVGAAIAWSR